MPPTDTPVPAAPAALAPEAPGPDAPTSTPIPPEPEVRARLSAAVEARRALPTFDDPTAALRLCDGHGDGLPRLVVERYADALWLRGPPAWAAHRATLVTGLRAALGTPAAPCFWRFGHTEVGGPDDPTDLGERTVREHGLRFNVQLGAHRNPGLFLDGRDARAWVQAHSAGAAVLNLFAFTCAFGVAAAAGGARRTCNVDDAGGALARGAEHYALNDLPADARTFWRRDATKALRELRAKNARFDGVVLDPPPVRPGSDAGEACAWHLRLARHARAAVVPGGWLVVLSAAAGVDVASLAAALDLEAPEWVGGGGPDFRPQPEAPHLLATAWRLPA